MTAVRYLDVAINNITQAAGWTEPPKFLYKYDLNEETGHREGIYPECLEWLDEREKPFTDEEIIAECEAVVADRAARLYQFQRKNDYANIKDQLDALWHDIHNGTVTTDGDFYQLVNSTKTKYPKPSE
jgi:hypothetical protein